MRSSTGRILRLTAWTAFICGVTLVTPTSVLAEEPGLDEILAGFDEVQASIQTLHADFVQTTVNQMFKDPLVAEGRFYMTKPDAILMEFDQPEPMRFVIADDRYTGYFPDRKQAETRSVKRFSDRLFRFIGLGQVSSELAKMYDISLDAESSTAETYVLVFDPRKKRVRRKLAESVKFWVDAKTWLPSRIEYNTPSGNSRVIEFSNIEINPDLAATLYEVDLPADVSVTNSFGGLPGFGEADVN